jgi:sugar lactone lactonase YvrE
MRLEPLYRLDFTYPRAWVVEVGSGEAQYLFFAEGRAEGTLAGTFRGANHPRRRADGTFLPDFQAVIETDDGAVVLVDLRGYGRAYPPERREVVGTCTHLSEDDRYRRLNDVVCVCTGDVRPRADGPGMDLTLEIAELVWEPPAE